MTASIDVLHVKETYLQKSEKWFHYILNLNSGGKKWLACRFTNNLEEFPLGKTELLRVSHENLLEKIINRGSRRLIDRPVLWGAAAYAAVVKSVPASVVHAHYGPMGYVLSMGQADSKPFVTSFYGYDISTEILGLEGTLKIGYLRETPVMLMTKNSVAHDTVPYFMERFRDAYTTQLQNFAQNVLQDRPAPITIDDGLEALRIGVAATRAHETQLPVTVADIQ